MKSDEAAVVLVLMDDRGRAGPHGCHGTAKGAGESWKNYPEPGGRVCWLDGGKAPTTVDLHVRTTVATGRCRDQFADVAQKLACAAARAKPARRV